MYKIYGLIDPRDCKIFYVGRTAKKPQTRLNEHLNETNKTSLKQQRIKSIKSETSVPISYVVLEANIISEKQAFCKEVFWMETLIKSGAELTNATIDFDGTYFFREDTLESDFTEDNNEGSVDETYISASHSWESDNEIADIDDVEEFLDSLDGKFFKLEEFLKDKELLEKSNMCESRIREKRLTNIRSQRLINHGFPILEDEIQVLLKRHNDGCNLVYLEEYFQRSRKSLERMLEDNL